MLGKVLTFHCPLNLVRVIGAESEALVSKAPGQISVAVSRHKNLKIHVNAVFKAVLKLFLVYLVLLHGVD